jgi:hypothetical protein
MAEGIGILGMAASAAGTLAGANQAAFQAESQVRTAKIQANQADTVALGDLKRQLGNIAAIRASAGGRVDSPTYDAVVASERGVSDANRHRTQFGYQNQENIANADKSMIDSLKWVQLGGDLFQGLGSLARFGG